MYNLTIKGHAQTTLVIAWLKKQKWNYDIQFKHTDPFSDEYHLTMADKQQAFMTQLTWGLV